MTRKGKRIERTDRLRRPPAAGSGTVTAARLPGALWREQEGATAVLIAMSLVAFLGAVALSVDLSRAYNLHSQLQQGADAAALAAASQLDNTVGSLDRACEAATGQAAYPCLGPTAGNLTTAIVQNQQQFASDGAGGQVAVFQVRFLEQLGTGPGDPDPASRVYIDTLGISETEAEVRANFVEVTVVPREVAFPFAAAIGAVDSASPGAVAVSGLGEATCKVPPMMVCNPGDDGSDPLFNADDYIRRGIKLDEGGAGQWTAGNFGLLSVSDPGANAVRDAMGRVNPIADCFGESVNSKTGQVTSIKQGLNVRFNVYEAGFSKGEIEDPQYRPSRHSGKGMIKGGPQCGFSGTNTNGWHRPANPFGYNESLPGGWTQGVGPHSDLAVTAVVQAMGLPRDNCHYDHDPVVADLGNDAGCPDDRWGDGDWDLDSYMQVNHAGVVYSAAITTIGGVDVDSEPYGAADGVISRFEVYEWEKATFMMPLGAGIPGTGSTTPTSEDGWPTGAKQCSLYTEALPPDQLVPDRRVIAVAVVNCESPVHDCGGGGGCTTVQGDTDDIHTVNPDGFLGIFLTEAMGTHDGNNTLYGEVIGRINSDLFATVSRKIVHLYE